ncbi:glycosyltransferase family 2 protein [Desulfogranum mediterraneum]|uniref:glycosyltransferase family 2 protein n=1 Tax=Desulfogranum mediterraneum TaxID=160661 RepID=UPI000403B8ED|nr:glycosyltransferase family 2 protein [Desulfogranum mediterraneum]
MVEPNPATQAATPLPPGESVSVIIPTYFAEAWLESLLKMLMLQTIPLAEILVVDSGSTDRTREILQRYPTTLVEIEAADFDHGGTRTMAASRASGSILVFLTQDAIPADEEALERLLGPLLAEPSLGASYGRQLANVDASPFSEHLRLFNYPEESWVRSWEDRAVHGFKTIFISNSFAAYRKSRLAEVDYFPDNILFGEDTCTVAALLQRGYLVGYVGDARVYHSHNYTLVQEFKRYFDIGALHSLQPELLAHFGQPTGAGKRFVRSEMVFLLNQGRYGLIPFSLLRNGLKYIAYFLGRRQALLPRSLARFFSMHHRWWK